ncbi:MAG: hypothetical protein LBM07_04485 [Culturomica sp.]|jgi:hypothetical protein|nr:hypothetical protein [Culturomica sp.]
MKRRFERESRGKFELKPIYWDPEKEEREEREKRIRAELGVTDEHAYIPNIEGVFRGMYHERKEARKGRNGKYVVRMFLILLSILLLGFYLISKFGENMVEYFM